MSAGRQADPRENQRTRTRRALLEAAADLMRGGSRPTVGDAAEAARISRRTAYRYFPSQEQLLTEAALETLRPTIAASFEHIASDPEARLDAVVRAMQTHTAAHEDLLRTIIRLTVERRDDAREPVRGTRRVEWIAGALEPVRKRLGARAFARLVSGVSLCVGPEALITLRDVRGLDVDAAAGVASWSARALLRAALHEADAPAPVRPRRRRT